MRSGTAASLRWRSRLSKEAVNHDDSRFEDVVRGGGGSFQEDYGLSEQKVKASFLRPPKHWASRFSLILSIMTVASSIYVLEFDLTWYTAVASNLQIFLSFVLVYATRRIRRLGSVRQQVQYSQQRVQSLTTQNERLDPKIRPAWYKPFNDGASSNKN